MAGSDSSLLPRGEGLRRAVRWLAEQRRHDLAAVEEAARRFDLSPRDEDFLIARFVVPDSGGESAP